MLTVRSVVSCFIALVSLANSGELEYPGVKYCPVAIPCKTPLLYNVEYRCESDEGCSTGFKCCKTGCYIHKACVVPVDKNGDKIQPPTKGTTDSTNNQSSENVKEWPTSSLTIMSNETNTATELRNGTKIFPTLITLLGNFPSPTLEKTVSEHRYSNITDKTAPTVDIRISRLNDNYTNLDNTSGRMSTRKEENKSNFITITEKESTNVQETNIFSRFSAISFPGPHNFVKLIPAPKWIGIEGSGNDITSDDEDDFIGSGSGSGDDEGSGMIGENIKLTKETSLTEGVEGSGSDIESNSNLLTFIDDEDVFEGSGYKTSSHETAAVGFIGSGRSIGGDEGSGMISENIGLTKKTSLIEDVEGSGSDIESNSDLLTFIDDEDVFEGSGYKTSSHETAAIYPSSWNTSHHDFYTTVERSERSYSTNTIDINKSSDSKVIAEGSGDIYETRDDEDDDDGEITTLLTFDDTKSANETSNLSFNTSSLHSSPVGMNNNVTYEEEDDKGDGDGVDQDIRNNFQGKLIKG